MRKSLAPSQFKSRKTDCLRQENGVENRKVTFKEKKLAHLHQYCSGMFVG